MPTTLEQLARDILAEPVPTHDFGHIKHREFVIAAQAYLDNLSEGYDEPDELIELLAREEAADALPEDFPSRDEAGYSWHDGLYSADEWWDEELPHYIASVRTAYGMVAA